MFPAAKSRLFMRQKLCFYRPKGHILASLRQFLIAHPGVTCCVTGGYAECLFLAIFRSRMQICDEHGHSGGVKCKKFTW